MDAYVHLERLDQHLFCLIIEQGKRRVRINIGTGWCAHGWQRVLASVYADEPSEVSDREVDESEALRMESLGWLSVAAHERVTMELARKIRELQCEIYQLKGAKSDEKS